MNLKSIVTPVAGFCVFAGPGIVFSQAFDSATQDGFNLSYRMGFNVKANFKSLGAAAYSGTTSVNGVSYSDGFVGTDSTGNAGGLTTHWGYANASQVQPGNASLVLHSSQSGSLFNDVDGGLNNGFEISYRHHLGTVWKSRWGIEGAFNWSKISFSQSGTPASGALTADSFQLGYQPPPAGYSGPVTSGPGSPLLGTGATSVPVTSTASFDGSLYGMRFGPYLNTPLTHKLSLSLSAGAAMMLVDGNLKYNEYSSGTTSSMASSSRDLVYGGYASAQLDYAIGKRLGVSAGVQYQSTSGYSQTAGDKKVELNFTGALYCMVGMSYRF